VAYPSQSHREGWVIRATREQLTGNQDGKTGTLEELLIGSALVMNSTLANLKSKK
jgi:hypothetical protein